MRLHEVIGGEGPPLLLIHGWPQIWYQYRLPMPTLARDFRVIAVDQRGIGGSDIPQHGYDGDTLARDMVQLMDALGHQRFAVVGCDTGMLIGYAMAANYQRQVERLVVGEAVIPGVTPSLPLLLPSAENDRVFHLAFNHLATLNEQLVRSAKTSSSVSNTPSRPGRSCPTMPPTTTSTFSAPATTHCTAASGSTASPARQSRRTSSARPG